MTTRAVLAGAAGQLAARGVPTPEVDAEWLLAHVLGVSRSALQIQNGIAPAATARFEALVARRAQREPLAYVLGEWGFRRLNLKVDRRVLVPRPETEVLVERALALLRGIEQPRVLDVGVGSGAIALSIALEHAGARVTGVDVSPGALQLARENAARSGLPVELREGGVEVAAEGWDLVVSNPPYVAADELASLEPEVRDWEPRIAVVGEGLHEELARAAHTRWLALEVGDRQAPAVAAALTKLGYREVRITEDLAGRDRIVEGTR